MAPDFTTRGGGYSVCASNAWHYLAGVIGPKRYADFAPKVSRLIDCGEGVLIVLIRKGMTDTDVRLFHDAWRFVAGEHADVRFIPRSAFVQSTSGKKFEMSSSSGPGLPTSVQPWRRPRSPCAAMRAARLR